MKVIIRNFKNRAKQKIIDASAVSISYDLPGVFIESPDIFQIKADLELDGFKCNLQGRILNVEAHSVYCFN